MARKSRKETAAVAVQEADTACRAAIYVRLSVEDTHTHSVSIETQQMIIARYLEQYPEISVYDTYIDNGATGTNFHRPGFQQMLSDIEAGHVNCVIVKDLSRLGRNTIDTGYYIEQYFRIRSIRFIAVNENFDTANPEDAHSGIIIPLRNMINEAYALDIGRKIRAQQRQAMKDGKFIGARTPYGYLKAEDDCHQLIIDPVAAIVVQRMFRWASEGAGLNTIAVRLNEAGVLTPSHYKKMQGKITHENLLGSGKWHMIRTVVLPSSIDGIVTGCILAVGRIVGESAVLLYVGGMGNAMNDFFASPDKFLHSSGATLTVQLYVFAKERAMMDPAFAVAVVLLVLTLAINLAAKAAGKKLRQKN